jgi:hypothetical protein
MSARPNLTVGDTHRVALRFFSFMREKEKEDEETEERVNRE